MSNGASGAPAGWYPTGDGTLTERYWDGTTWGAQIRPTAPNVGPVISNPTPSSVRAPSAFLPAATFITGLFWVSIVAIVLGHITLSRSKKFEAAGGRFDGINTSYKRGTVYGLTYIGLVLGYIGAVGWIIVWILLIFTAVTTQNAPAPINY